MASTSYITINRRTYVLGHYDLDDQAAILALAKEELADALGLRVLPSIADDPAPMLLNHVIDETLLAD